MSSADKQALNDEVLSRYLLGSLPAEEAEHLDELSVADDEFALRLDAVENDLVDAYARGDLSGDELGQFQKFYLSSPKRREKVEFAKALLHPSEKNAPAVTEATLRPAIQGANPRDEAPKGRSPRRWFTVPRLELQWGFAAAALVMLVATGYLFMENQRLHRQATDARIQQIALNQHAQNLEGQLKEQRTANSGLQKKLEGLRASLPGAQALETIAVLLAPQTRGISQPPTISLPPGAIRLRVTLQLEADEFPGYQVALKDPATNHLLWRSAYVLRTRPEGNSKTASVTLSAKLFKPQNYILELSGVSQSGPPEIISSYPFRVVLE
jgi:hypothetical protein